MKTNEKAVITADDDEMLPAYDLTGGVRGVYAAQYAQGTNIRVLSPDLADVFPTSAAVNDALRALVQAAQQSVKVNSLGLTQLKNRRVPFGRMSASDSCRQSDALTLAVLYEQLNCVSPIAN